MFRVAWLREAVNELADIWIKADSPSRKAITEATHILDHGNNRCRCVFGRQCEFARRLPGTAFPSAFLKASSSFEPSERFAHALLTAFKGYRCDHTFSPWEKVAGTAG